MIQIHRKLALPVSSQLVATGRGNAGYILQSIRRLQFHHPPLELEPAFGPEFFDGLRPLAAQLLQSLYLKG